MLAPNATQEEIPDTEEISSFRWIPLPELAELLSNGIIKDSFTYSTLAKAHLLGLIELPQKSPLRLVMSALQENTGSSLLDAAACGHHEEVVSALQDKTISSPVVGWALVSAAHHGFVDCVATLIRDERSQALRNWALVRAAQQGHLECMEALVPVSDSKAYDSLTLTEAAANGHLDCVESLIPVSDPKTLDSVAFRMAARGSHLACLKALIPVSDPETKNNWALETAKAVGARACEEALQQAA